MATRQGDAMIKRLINRLRSSAYKRRRRRVSICRVWRAPRRLQEVMA